MPNKELPVELISSFEVLPISLYLLDENGYVIYSNSSGSSLVDVSHATLPDKNFLDFIDESSKVDFQNFIKNSSFSAEPQKLKATINTGFGNSFEAYLVAKSIKLPLFEENLCSLSVIDLSNFGISKELSSRSELRFENMANTAPVMIWIADVDGLFSFVNKVWLDYTGEKMGEQLGMNWLKNVHHDDYERLLGDYKEAFKSREHFSAEFRFKRMNGEYQWMLINGSPRVSEQGIFAGFIGSCININEQIKNEEKIKVINAELTESNKTKDKFFSIISHDLRGPLSGLMQLLEILDTEYKSINEKEKQRLISEAAASSKGTYNLMENLLDWSRIQSGKIQYQPQRLSLHQLVEETISLYNQNLKNKNISMENKITNDTAVFADEKMTETILRNLISNAIKFTFSKGKVTITSESKDDKVIVRVSDTGKGMSTDELLNLFRLDVSHSSKGTENESGSGLGLILCKELVERQGGKIWVESKVKEGSIFFFTLPLAV